MSTGIFTWIEPRQYTTKVGDVAGSIENTGYISIRINKVSYLAHRLAWFYCFEEWPESYIDHIDRDKTNNALDNLREATAFENSRNRAINKNNTSGYPGVYKRGSKWRAEIIIKGIKKYLGTFSTAHEAHLAYTEFNSIHGYKDFNIG